MDWTTYTPMPSTSSLREEFTTAESGRVTKTSMISIWGLSWKGSRWNLLLGGRESVAKNDRYLRRMTRKEATSARLTAKRSFCAARKAWREEMRCERLVWSREESVSVERR